MISDERDEVTKKNYSLKNRRENNLKSIRGSEFVFSCCIVNVIK